MDTGAEEQLHIKWTKTTSMHHVMKSLLYYHRIESTDRPPYTDVDIYCKGGYIPVHSVVLLACSDIWREAFKTMSPLQRENVIVHMTEYDIEDVTAVIECLYTGKCIFPAQRNQHVLEVFESFGIDSTPLTPKQATEAEIAGKMKIRRYLVDETIVESISIAAAVESSGVPEEFNPISNIDREENVGEESEARRDASMLEHQLLAVNQSSVSSTAASEVTSIVPNNEIQFVSEAQCLSQDEHDISGTGGGVASSNVTAHASSNNDDTPLELTLISEKEQQQENLATDRNAALFPGSAIDSVASGPDKLTVVTSDAHVEEIGTGDWDVPVGPKSSGPVSTTKTQYTYKSTTTSTGVQRERNEKYDSRPQLVQEDRGQERTFDGGRRMGKHETLLGLRRTTLKPGDPWAPAQVLKLLTTKGYVIEERIFFFMCKADGSIQMLDFQGQWVKDSIYVVELVCKLNAELLARGVAESEYKPLAFNAAALELIQEIQRKVEPTLSEVRVPFVLQMKPVAYFDMLRAIERKTRRAPIVTESFEHENGTKWHMCEVQYPVDGKTHHIRRTGISSVLARLAAAHDVLQKLEPRRNLLVRELSTCVKMAEETLSRVLRICPDRSYAPLQLDLVPLPSVADAQPTPPANVGHGRAPQTDQRCSRDSGSQAQCPPRASSVYSSQAVHSNSNVTKIQAVAIEDDWDLPSTNATRAPSGSSTQAVHSIVAKSPAVTIADEWDPQNTTATPASSGRSKNAVRSKVSKSSAVSIEDDWDSPSTASSSCPLVNIPNDANPEFKAAILQDEFTKTANQTYVIKADETDIREASASVISLMNIGEGREKGSSDTLSLPGEPEVKDNADSGSGGTPESQNITSAFRVPDESPSSSDSKIKTELKTALGQLKKFSAHQSSLREKLKENCSGSIKIDRNLRYALFERVARCQPKYGQSTLYEHSNSAILDNSLLWLNVIDADYRRYPELQELQIENLRPEEVPENLDVLFHAKTVFVTIIRCYGNYHDLPCFIGFNLPELQKSFVVKVGNSGTHLIRHAKRLELAECLWILYDIQDLHALRLWFGWSLRYIFLTASVLDSITTPSAGVDQLQFAMALKWTAVVQSINNIITRKDISEEEKLCRTIKKLMALQVKLFNRSIPELKDCSTMNDVFDASFKARRSPVIYVPKDDRKKLMIQLALSLIQDISPAQVEKILDIQKTWVYDRAALNLESPATYLPLEQLIRLVTYQGTMDIGVINTLAPAVNEKARNSLLKLLTGKTFSRVLCTECKSYEHIVLFCDKRGHFDAIRNASIDVESEKLKIVDTVSREMLIHPAVGSGMRAAPHELQQMHNTTARRLNEVAPFPFISECSERNSSGDHRLLLYGKRDWDDQDVVKWLHLVCSPKWTHHLSSLEANSQNLMFDRDGNILRELKIALDFGFCCYSHAEQLKEQNKFLFPLDGGLAKIIVLGGKSPYR